MHPDLPNFEIFSLTFDTTGTYEYLCVFHKFQRGTITVEPSEAADLPDQAAIDA